MLGYLGDTCTFASPEQNGGSCVYSHWITVVKHKLSTVVESTLVSDSLSSFVTFFASWHHPRPPTRCAAWHIKCRLCWSRTGLFNESVSMFLNLDDHEATSTSTTIRMRRRTRPAQVQTVQRRLGKKNGQLEKVAMHRATSLEFFNR